MPVTIKVKRYNPEGSDEASRSWWQEYQVEVNQFSTVLDTLMEITRAAGRHSWASLFLSQRDLRLLRHACQRPRRFGLQDQGKRRSG